jgi:integrase/recombinase XerD
VNKFDQWLQELQKVCLERSGEPKQCVVTDEEVEKVMQYINGYPDLFQKSLHRVLLETPRWLGSRIGEVCNFKLDDFDFERDRVHIRKSKNGRSLDLGLPKRLKPTLLDYRNNYRPESECDSFFLLKNGKPLTVDRAEKIFKKFRDKTGIKRLTPHSLRRLFCTRNASRGVPLPHIQYALNHSSLSMVMHYYKEDQENIIRAQVNW